MTAFVMALGGLVFFAILGYAFGRFFRYLRQNNVDLSDGVSHDEKKVIVEGMKKSFAEGTALAKKFEKLLKQEEKAKAKEARAKA